MIPIALARSCFSIGIHARFVVLREITGHSGRALVPEKGQWMSYVGVLSPGAALHTTTLGRLLRDGAERVWVLPSATMPS